MAGVQEICRLGWNTYRPAPWLTRLLMTARPLICPLDVAAEAVPAGSHVLDVGCGAGLWLRWLARDRQIASGVGVDVSAKAIAIAAACAAGEEALRFEHVEPEEPWPAGSFEVVTAIDVLHHVPPEDQRRFVADLAEKAERRVVLKDVAPTPCWRAWANALHDFLMTRSRVYPRPMDEVAAWLQETGLTVVRAERVHRACYSHYLVVADRQAEKTAP
jgi:cyclopropane fatty-acyl-phospholipid synthase-like methyltransferase